MFILFFHPLKRRFLMSFIVLLLLSGCGQSVPDQNLPETPTPVHSGSVASPSGSLTTGRSVPLGTSVSFDLGGWIHIESVGGFTCSFSNQDPLTPGTLVLPTVRPTYDQGTLQSVKSYLTTVSNTNGNLDIATERRDTVPYPAFSANPDAFQLVPVSGATTGGTGDICNEIVHITNIGNAAVQIAQVSVRFTTDTHANTQHYNLIDVCSFVPPISVQAQVCGPLGSGGEPVYTANFALHPGKAGTIISDDSQVLLQPGDVAKVIIYYRTLDNLSFSLIPTFTLVWPGTGKQTTYPAPQLQETLAFASASQFSCYALQGQQFIEVPLDPKHWCI